MIKIHVIPLIAGLAAMLISFAISSVLVSILPIHSDLIKGLVIVICTCIAGALVADFLSKKARKTSYSFRKDGVLSILGVLTLLGVLLGTSPLLMKLGVPEAASGWISLGLIILALIGIKEFLIPKLRKVWPARQASRSTQQKDQKNKDETGR